MSISSRFLPWRKTRTGDLAGQLNGSVFRAVTVMVQELLKVLTGMKVDKPPRHVARGGRRLPGYAVGAEGRMGRLEQRGTWRGWGGREEEGSRGVMFAVARG